MKTKLLLVAVLFVVAVPAFAQGKDIVRDDTREHSAKRFDPGVGTRPEEAEEAVELRYVIRATGARVNRKLMGPVRREVQGIPAEPVDSFVWDGDGSTPIDGFIEIDVQPMTSTGYVLAEWTDQHGTWTYKQRRFTPPHHHSAGVRIGSSVSLVDAMLGSISHNVYLHGNTTAGPPVLPTVFAYLAAWGPAAVTLNGEPFENPFELPRPLWDAHLMVTEGVRGEDGSVRTLTGEIYNPSSEAIGAVEQGDLEVHLTWHDDVFPLTSNIPPIFSFFYHLVFEDVSIEIIQADAPRKPSPTAFPRAM